MKVIDKNPFGQSCVATSTKEKFTTKETLWGAASHRLEPARLTTAWLLQEDPLMVIAGEGYRVKEVRDISFKLQEEALLNLRGNRKLTKAKIGDAFSSLKPTTDQTKVIAAVLFALKQVQTVCFDEVEKTIWTVPEDLSIWSVGLKTLWVSEGCEKTLIGDIHLGKWIMDREEEGWKMSWPIAEGTFEEIKNRMSARGLTPTTNFGAKPKKEDWARALGRAEAIERLG